MPKLIAKDLMTARPMTLYSSDSLDHAVKIFSQYRVSSAAVLTPDKKILGLITDTNLMKMMIHAMEAKKMREPLHLFPTYLSRTTTVQDLDSISDVLIQMLHSASGRVLVLDSQNNLIGIISPKDVFQYTAGVERSSKSMYDELAQLKEEIHRKTELLDMTSIQLHRLEDLINGNSYMMHSIDLNGKIIMANRRIHEALEYNYGELVGKSLEDLYDKTAAPLARDQLERLKEGKEQDLIRTAFKRKNGQLLMVEIITSTVKDRDGNFIATSSMSRLMDSDQFLRVLHQTKVK